MTNLFNRQSGHQVPVWFMRQAGRYHQHYQNLKKNHDFMTLCKDPTLACEVTMGPIEDFKFDAAILFSDLLFPLEELGMGLVYNPGPQLSFNLKTHQDFQRLTKANSQSHFYSFQRDACQLLTQRLPPLTTLLGFTGAPFTLFTYASEGSHSGALSLSKTGLYDNRFHKFYEIIKPILLGQMSMQAQGGAHAICLFDTAAGELNHHDYKTFLVPVIEEVAREFKAQNPGKKVVYYARNAPLSYFKEFKGDVLDVVGIDWRVDLTEALVTLSERFMIQGNLDPCWLHLSWQDLEKNLTLYKENLTPVKHLFHRWISGLGHGVLQWTPEENVRQTVRWLHENFKN
jgi:uroporphyrinogen decarboxylase